MKNDHSFNLLALIIIAGVIIACFQPASSSASQNRTLASPDAIATKTD